MLKKYEELMRICLEDAKKYRFEVAPNPMVCAIVYDEINDKIISKGVHKKYGENHAERNAIIEAGDIDFSDKTLIVNLEPCSHQGKTPPCADLIIEKGFKKVVMGIYDPNPLVCSQGAMKLKNAGVEVVTGILEDECKELNKVFIKNVTKKMPYVTVKIATTFDSKIVTAGGESKWVTGEASRAYVQKLRAQHFGILSGSGTILADNPALTCRIKGEKSPQRIIVDRHGKISFDYQVFKDDGTRVFLATNNLERDFPKNVTPVEFVNFRDLFLYLFNQGVYSILVETGKTILTALIKQEMADEIYKFVSPKIFGNGMDFVGNLNIFKINEAYRLKFEDMQRVEEDILIKAKFLYDE